MKAVPQIKIAPLMKAMLSMKSMLTMQAALSTILFQKPHLRLDTVSAVLNNGKQLTEQH